MSPLEIIAVVAGLLCVGLTIRQSVWCWPTGLVQVALYIIIFKEAKLYADMALQVVYVGLQIYGWWCWVRGGPREDGLPVTGLGRRARLGWIASAAVGTLAIGFGTATWTDAALPYPDAFITATSLVAQTLLAHKRWESWVGWILVDVVAIPVYAAKDLWLTSGLYAVFLGMAIAGLVEWRRKCQVS